MAAPLAILRVDATPTTQPGRPRMESRSPSEAIVPGALPERARQLVRSWETLWGAPGLADRISFLETPRMRRTLGRCSPQRYIVRLAAGLGDAPAHLLEETVCHEAAHVLVFERQDRATAPHGAAWKELMRLAGFTPRTRVPALTDPGLHRPRRGRSDVIYEHHCPVCHATRPAHRPMARWRCSACVRAGLGGELRITSRHPEAPER